MRDQFLSELDLRRLHDLADLNARLWAWLEELYHRRAHSALHGHSPLQRYQQDLARIRTLGQRAARLDELFYHRLPRKVRKDATVSYQGQRFEVPYVLTGQSVQWVVDPHSEQAVSLEDAEGKPLGEVTPLDVLANNHRRRRKPRSATQASPTPSSDNNLVEVAYRQHYALEEGQAPESATQKSRTETTRSNADEDKE